MYNYKVLVTLADFGGIQEHLLAWEINLVELSLSEGYIYFSTNAEIPADQLEHLSIEVAE